MTKTMPDGCKCYLEASWLRCEHEVICDEYDEYVGFGGAWCKTCAHRKACHVDESDMMLSGIAADEAQDQAIEEGEDE